VLTTADHTLTTLRSYRSELVRWAQCKYRKFEGKPTRAREWLKKVVSRQPRLFVYWLAHGKVAVRTMEPCDMRMSRTVLRGLRLESAQSSVA